MKYSRSILGAALSLMIVASACSDKKPSTTPPADSPATSTSQAPAPQSTPQPSQSPTPQPAPPLTWRDASGEHSLAELRGKVVLVNFWGTWCPPCRAELPDLVKVRGEMAKDVEVLGVAVNEQPRGGLTAEGNLAKFAAEYNISYPVFIGSDDIARAFGAIGGDIEVVPTTFVVDRKGMVISRHQGALDEASIREAIRQAM